MTFWKNATRHWNASWKSASVEEVNKNRKMPVSIVEIAIVPLRPTYLISTVNQAMKLPGVPMTEMIA